MEYILFFAGAALVALGFLMEHPKFKERISNPLIEKSWALEEQRILQLRHEAVTAKEDVAALLVELDRVSASVVDSIEHKLEELNKLNEHKTISLSIQEQETRNNLANEIKAKAKEDLSGIKKVTRTKKNLEEKTTQSQQPARKTSTKEEQIQDLADRGLPLGDIAKKLQIGKGEVELILGLRGRSD